ncbi:carbon-nitrogen hydrolase [Xylogone sp. PMI_703]|nr:carbon-nitrogen hydrolase [Xylogone sp. PMI_703]
MGSAVKSSVVRVAVTQHEPVWLDLEGTVNKTCSIVEEAAKAGAKLVAFPETWIPGYPCWFWGRPFDFELGVRYVQNSLRIDSPEMKRICDAAAAHKINISLGFSERDGDSVYISQALIDEHGEIQMKRRKMKPTHMERTVYGDGSGDSLARVVDIPGVGRVGSLSCWEHNQPLLKYYTFSQHEQIHVAGWPPLDPFVEGSSGFWSMSAEGALNQSQTYAIESQSFVLHSTGILTNAGIESMRTKGNPIMGTPLGGCSAIIGPDGRVLSTAKTSGEELIIADIDLADATKAKLFADASGHCKNSSSAEGYRG